jgi:hypothetical protein
MLGLVCSWVLFVAVVLLCALALVVVTHRATRRR